MGLIIAEGDLGGHARSGLFERTFPMKFVIGLVAGASALCLASSALAAPPAPIAPGDEAAWGFYFKSDHRAVVVPANTAFIKSAPSSKALAGGICVSRDNNTEFFIYMSYANFEDLFTSQGKLPSADILALQHLQYRAQFKPLFLPLMPIGNTDSKTVHQFFRFSVPFKNTEAFVQAAAKANAMVATEIKGAAVAVFQPAAGGGTNEVNVLHVRIIYPDNKSLGIGMDNYFKGGKAGATFNEMWSLSTGIASNSVEDCDQFSYAKK